MSKVLIVEDEPDIRELFLNYIEPYGEGVGVEDGRAALYAVDGALRKKKTFGLILLDVMMPHMNGLDALAGIREVEEYHGVKAGHEAKIIMTTALGDPKSILGSFRSQCDGYIVKPMTRSGLLSELRNSGLIV